MSRPAARQGDPTAGGGVISGGLSSVLICGRPAARVGDLYAFPQAATPGGPITTGSQTVLIGGQPAAREGDTVARGQTSDVIASGCTTVLIGE